MKWIVVTLWLSIVAPMPNLAVAADAAAFGPRSPPPHRIAGNLYNVGSKGHNSFLIATDAGHFLIDTGFDQKFLDRSGNARDDEQVGPKQIQEHIAALGFEASDIKFILCTHSHMDHVGGHAEMKRATGAQVLVMAGDEERVRTGEAGTEWAWTPSSVDRVLQDGDELKLGGTSLRAHRTPGHTKGATTWTFQVMEDGRKRDVVLLDSAWFWFESDAEYPDRGSDYQRTLRIVEELPCDILLDPHGYYYQRLRTPAPAGGARESSNPFINPQACARFIKDKQAELLEHLRKERSTPASEVARIHLFENSLRPAVSVRGQPEQRWTLQERMAHWKVPGLSIAVIREGKIAWAKGYGVLQAGGKEPVDTETMFSVGSVSKVGAAAVTLRLVDAGKLDLDRDVNDLLTRWKVRDNQYTVVRPVTLRGVMSHSAGLSVHGFDDYQPDEILPTTVDTLFALPILRRRHHRGAIGHRRGDRRRLSFGGSPLRVRATRDEAQLL